MIKIPIIINKRNKQIGTYFRRKQLPKKFLKTLKEQPNSIKKILIDLRGFE